MISPTNTGQQVAGNQAGLSKAKLKALERIYAAEISNRLPLQSKAQIYYDLWADGLVDIDRAKFGALIVDGWCLTHAGRFLYCSAQESP